MYSLSEIKRQNEFTWSLDNESSKLERNIMPNFSIFENRVFTVRTFLQIMHTLKIDIGYSPFSIESKSYAREFFIFPSVSEDPLDTPLIFCLPSAESVAYNIITTEPAQEWFRVRQSFLDKSFIKKVLASMDDVLHDNYDARDILCILYGATYFNPWDCYLPINPDPILSDVMDILVKNFYLEENVFTHPESKQVRRYDHVFDPFPEVHMRKESQRTSLLDTSSPIHKVPYVKFPLLCIQQQMKIIESYKEKIDDGTFTEMTYQKLQESYYRFDFQSTIEEDDIN